MSSPGKTVRYDPSWESQQDGESWQMTITNATTPSNGTTSVPSADSSAYNQYRSTVGYATLPDAYIFGAARQDTVFAPEPHKGHAYAGSNAASMAVQGAEPSATQTHRGTHRHRQAPAQDYKSSQSSQNPMGMPQDLFQNLTTQQREREAMDAEAERIKEEELKRALAASRAQAAMETKRQHLDYIAEETLEQHSRDPDDKVDNSFWFEDEDEVYDWDE